jgi:hypothetical protein
MHHLKECRLIQFLKIQSKNRPIQKLCLTKLGRKESQNSNKLEKIQHFKAANFGLWRPNDEKTSAKKFKLDILR